MARESWGRRKDDNRPYPKSPSPGKHAERSKPVVIEYGAGGGGFMDRLLNMPGVSLFAISADEMLNKREVQRIARLKRSMRLIDLESGKTYAEGGGDVALVAYDPEKITIRGWPRQDFTPKEAAEHMEHVHGYDEGDPKSFKPSYH